MSAEPPVPPEELLRRAILCDEEVERMRVWVDTAKTPEAGLALAKALQRRKEARSLLPRPRLVRD